MPARQVKFSISALHVFNCLLRLHWQQESPAEQILSRRHRIVNEYFLGRFSHLYRFSFIRLVFKAEFLSEFLNGVVLT